MICAVDFETYYDAEVSITTLGVYHYLRHPQADLYLVSIATDTGIQYVGDPLTFDWNSISGPGCTWLSHNAQFDLPVFQRIQEIAAEKNIANVPQHLEIDAWHDTADLTAWLNFPRSLKEAADHLLGVKLSKDVRDKMKGQRWAEMTPEFREEVCKYALDDAVYCLDIWLEHSHKWPENERKTSQMTRDMAMRGVPLDLPGIDSDIELLKTSLWEYKQSIPWKDDHALLSPIALRNECAKEGLIAPASFAQNDPESEAFFEEFGPKFPWLMAVRDYRKAAKHLATLETMRKRVRPDGWMGYELKYGGAHTMRDSGMGGINMQNLPKGFVSGVDIRAKIKAPEGYTFAIVDLSQIEPRVLHFLAKDKNTLKYIRECEDLYEAFARAWGLFSGEGTLKERDPDLRFKTKTLALGLGYGMGAAKFTTVAGVTAKEASELVQLYREKNKAVTSLWSRLQAGFDETLVKKEVNFFMELPSGRTMTYRNVSGNHGGRTAEIPRLGKLMRLGFWGGVLTENAVQSVSRDVFMHHCLKIEEAGIPVLMRIHDEVVCLVPEESAQERLNQIISIMSIPPSWAKELPLAADGSISKVYKK